MQNLLLRVRQGELMRYSDQHIEEMKQYSKSIGLNDQLFEYPKTKEQADGLLLLQDDVRDLPDFIVMDELYIAEHYKQIDEPTKIELSANKKLKGLIEYCEKINSAESLTALSLLENIELPKSNGCNTSAALHKRIKKEYLDKVEKLGFKSKSEEIVNSLLLTCINYATRARGAYAL